MGILNITPDSFYDGGRYQLMPEIEAQVERLCADGADIIDLGFASTRPFAEVPTENEELQHVKTIVPSLIRKFPQICFSIDTFRASVVEVAANEGIAIINDVSGGRWDPKMLETVAHFQLPYVLMHSKDLPAEMQKNPHYEHLLDEVLAYFAQHVQTARQLGINDIWIDPGFGFAKTLNQNYQLLAALDRLHVLDLPILVGVSRKSMIQKVLDVEPQQALNGTTALHVLALLKGAAILRVHDPKEARQAILITQKFIENDNIN